MKNNSVIGICFIFWGFLACQSPEKIKEEQYYVNGQGLYEKHCANCHQNDGKGLNDLYPPILNSGLLQDKKRLVCMIRHGSQQNSGTKFTNMPSNNQLLPLDIAEISTYISHKWGQERVIIDTDSVSKYLKNCY